MRRLPAYELLAVAALYGACADPPKQFAPRPADGSGGSAGQSGATASGGSSGKGVGGAGAGKGGSSAQGGKGGATGGGKGGSPSAGGTGGSDVGGEAGVTMGTSGEGGMSGGMGGEGAVAGEGGAPPAPDPCEGFTVGASGLPLPPTTGVAQPDGTPGNLEVIDWAGFVGALSFTFDDSLQSQIDHYDEINAVGVPMTFYMVCANDGAKTAWKTAYEDGHELGNHTMHHCYVNGSGCGWGAFTGVDSELDDCTAHLKSAFGVEDVYTMASPMGDPPWAGPAAERFVANRGVYDAPNGVQPNDSTDPYTLPCHIAANHELAASGTPNFNAVTDSVRSLGAWKIILSHALTANDGYNPVDTEEIVAAMTYAKGFGDVWIDRVMSIAAYWRAQKAIGDGSPQTSGSDIVYSWKLPDHFPPRQYARVKVDGGTVKQCGAELTWDDHGYYEVALDVGAVTVSP